MRNKWINRIGNLLLVISILFISITLYKQNIKLTTYVNSMKDIYVYIFIIVIYITSIYMNANVYNKILQIFSKEKITKDYITEVYISSNLGKYLPGNVMHFISRNVLATKYGISQSNMAIATILELMMILLISGLVIVAFAFKYIFSVINFLFEEYILILIGIGCIGILIFIVLIAFYFKFKKKIRKFIKEINLKKAKKLLIQCIIIDFFVQIVSSSTYILVILTIYDKHIQSWFSLLGIYLIAWTVGFIMPGVPGGIGIKESILILLLEGIFPKNIILVSVVVHRCLNILAEVVTYIIMKLTMKYKYNNKK